MIKSLFLPYEDFKPIKLLALGQAAMLIVLWILFPSQIIPTPAEILREWNDLALHQGLLVELMNSARTIWLALGYSTLISLGIAYLSTAVIFRPISGWLTGLRFLGFAGITFLFTLWTSTGFELKVWLLTFGMTTFLLTNMLSVVFSVKQEEIDYARTLRMSGWRITYETILLGRLDEAFDLIRQNAAMGWVMLSMVEGLVRSEGGIGALLLNQSKHLHLSAIFAIQLTILIYGIIQDVVLRELRNFLCPYVKLSQAR